MTAPAPETQPAVDVVAPATAVQPAESVVTEATEAPPTWFQKELEKARADAAKYRTRAKEAEAKAAETVGAESADKIAAVVAEKAATEEALSASNMLLTKILVATAQEGISGQEEITTFASLLQGTTKEEIEAHAAQVSKLLGTSKKTRAIDPSQGTSGSVPATEPAPGLDRLRNAYNKASQAK